MAHQHYFGGMYLTLKNAHTNSPLATPTFDLQPDYLLTLLHDKIDFIMTLPPIE